MVKEPFLLMKKNSVLFSQECGAVVQITLQVIDIGEML